MGDTRTWEEAVAERQRLMHERERLTAEIVVIDRAVAMLDHSMMAALEAERMAVAALTAASSNPGVTVDPASASQRPRPLFNSASEYFLWAMQQPGDFDIVTAAIEYYGANSPENRRRVSREIWNLKKAGKIREVGPHRYEVIK